MILEYCLSSRSKWLPGRLPGQLPHDTIQQFGDADDRKESQK